MSVFFFTGWTWISCLSHEQNGGNDSSSVFFKVIFESVPALDLDHSPSENPPYTFAGRSWDLCSLWSDVIVKLSLFWKLIMRLLFTKRIWGVPKPLCEHSWLGTQSLLFSSKIPGSSHVLASLRSGCWPQLASSSWWSKGGCHCLVFLPGSRTHEEGLLVVLQAKWLQQLNAKYESWLLSQDFLATLSAQCKKTLVSELAERVQWGWEAIQEALIEHPFIKCQISKASPVTKNSTESKCGEKD